MIYTSERKFRIWAYTVSHGNLLIRSLMKFSDQEGYSDETSYNIDMEFWAVEYIDIPSFLDNVTISKSISVNLPEKIQEKMSKESKIFKIESNGINYFIVAGGCIVGHNKWGLADRIFNYDRNLKHDTIVIEF